MLDSLRSRLRQAEYRRKLLHTFSLFFCFVGSGICTSLTGPALLDLQIITHTNTEQASVFILGTSIGSMVGSLSVAVIFGRCRGLLILFFALVGSAVSMTSLPWCSDYGLMIFMHGVVAMFRTAYTTVGNADIIRMWQAERRIFLQALYFWYALGGTIGPIIVEPFLAGATSTNTSELSNPQLLGNTSKTTEPTTHVQYAYLINGVVFLIGSIMILVEFCVSKKETKDTPKASEKYESLDKPLPKMLYIPTLLLILTIFFFVVSIEISLSAYLLTFVVTYLHWTKTEGAAATSAFWACFAAWRFATIFFTNKTSPFLSLIVTSLTILTASVGGLFSSLYQNEVGLYFCICLGGLSLASQFPTVMVWTEESIIRLSPRVISAIVTFCTLPGFVIPVLNGYLIQEVTPLWFFYLLILESAMTILFLFGMFAWNRSVVQPAYRRLNHILVK